MFKRLFFAIEPSPEKKEELYTLGENLRNDIKRGVKWVEKENLHITLSFSGKVREDRVGELKKKMEGVGGSPFSVPFHKITYMPPDKKKARMIWIKGESYDLAELHRKIEDKIAPSFKKREEKEFIPHITLARIKSWEFRKMPLASIPEVDEEINLSIPVSSFVLMESKLEKGGPVYEVISKFELYEGE